MENVVIVVKILLSFLVAIWIDFENIYVKDVRGLKI